MLLWMDDIQILFSRTYVHILSRTYISLHMHFYIFIECSRFYASYLRPFYFVSIWPFNLWLIRIGIASDKVHFYHVIRCMSVNFARIIPCWPWILVWLRTLVAVMSLTVFCRISLDTITVTEKHCKNRLFLFYKIQRRFETFFFMYFCWWYIALVFFY